MQRGWISIHRQLQDCWIWNDEPFSKGQSWVDLLLSANHEEKKMHIGNKLVTIHSGQFHTSVLKLARRWQWSEKKVKRFLELLKSDNMITYEGGAHGTTLTIVNYEFYQNGGRTVDRANAEHSTEQVPNTRPTNNNDKNENNEKKKVFVPPTVDEVRAYCQERHNNVDPERFVNFYESKGWMIGKNKMKDFKAAVRNWEKRDKAEPKKDKFNNFKGRSYDFAELEREAFEGG